MSEKRLNLRNSGPVATIQPEPDYAQACGVHEVFDNVELITYVKFQYILLMDAKIWTKN